MSAEPIGIGTMQDMAEDTGGRAFVNTNDLTGAIREAIEDSVATYTLGFYIDNDSIDGKFHEIKLEVKRKGVILHYPEGLLRFSRPARHKGREPQQPDCRVAQPNRIVRNSCAGQDRSSRETIATLSEYFRLDRHSQHSEWRRTRGRSRRGHG